MQAQALQIPTTLPQKQWAAVMIHLLFRSDPVHSTCGANSIEKNVYIALLLEHWYEIMALYYVKSILTEISASRQDKRVLQKSKVLRINFLGIWGVLQTSRYV